MPSHGAGRVLGPAPGGTGVAGAALTESVVGSPQSLVGAGSTPGANAPGLEQRARSACVGFYCISTLPGQRCQAK